MQKQNHLSHNLKNINTGYFTINTTTTTQTLCTELINFLNCNFDNYDDCFMWFTKFFTSYIIYTGEDDINKFEVNKLYSFNKVKELFKKYFEEIKNDSKRGQKLLSEFVDYIFNINNIEEIKDFTSKIRFYIYYNSHSKKLDRFINNYFSIPQGFSFRTISGIKGSTEKDLIKFFKSAPDYDVEPDYSSSNDNIYGILYVTLFITDNARINYCNNLYKGKQTCRDIGNQIAQRIKQENEIVYGKYRKIYAKKAMLVNRNPDIEVYKIDYENWKKQAKEFMDAIRSEKKTYKEFDKWLEENK